MPNTSCGVLACSYFHPAWNSLPGYKSVFRNNTQIGTKILEMEKGIEKGEKKGERRREKQEK